MKILVCIKQILDPELSARDFEVDPTGKCAQLAGANQVTNIFCENALETALQFREAVEGSEVTVLSLGPESVEDGLRKALAMKADRAIRVEGANGMSPYSLGVAQVLAAAIKKRGGFDLILLGREAGDWGMGQTGAFLAEALQIPMVSFVDSIRATGQELELRRQTDEGWERFEVQAPVLATITNSDDNLPRIPKTRDIMKSARIPIEVETLASLGIADIATEPIRVEVESLYIPENTVECTFAEGDSMDEKVEGLADQIAGVLKNT